MLNIIQSLQTRLRMLPTTKIYSLFFAMSTKKKSEKSSWTFLRLRGSLVLGESIIDWLKAHHIPPPDMRSQCYDGLQTCLELDLV